MRGLRRSDADTARTVLVTGGAGFIGTYVCEALVRHGVRVRVLDDFSAGGHEHFHRLTRELAAEFAARLTTKFEVCEGSIESPATVARALNGVSDVVHLAAKTSVAESMTSPELYQRVNVAGTRTLLDAARAAGVRRVVFAASSSAYGDQRAPHIESMEPQPMSPYATSKLSGEEEVHAFARGTHTAATKHASTHTSTDATRDGVSLRFFNVYGPEQNPRSSYAAVIARFSERVVRQEAITLFGDGTQTRDFVHVTDVARAVILALDAPKPLGGYVLNIGTGIATSISDLAQTMQRLVTHEVEVQRLPAREGEVKHSVADTELAAKMLGFRAKIALEAGLRAIINLRGEV